MQEDLDKTAYSSNQEKGIMQQEYKKLKQEFDNYKADQDVRAAHLNREKGGEIDDLKMQLQEKQEIIEQLE